MIFLSILAAVTLASAAESPPAFRWAKIGTGGGTMRSHYGLTVDSFGRPFVAGDFRNGASFEHITLTNSGLFVTKYDRSGNLMWAMQDASVGLSGPVTNAVWGLSIAAKGTNGFALGCKLQADQPTLFAGSAFTNRGYASILLARYDEARNPIWARQFDGAGEDMLVDMLADWQGNWVWSGAGGNGQYGETNLSASGGLVAKCDDQGRLIWLNVAASESFARCHRLAVDQTGNVFVTGWFSGVTSFGSTNLSCDPFAEDLFLAKYAPNGSLLWVRQAGGPYSDSGVDVATDSQGACVLTGMVWCPAQFGDTTFGAEEWSQMMFLAKYDSEGRLLWVRQGLDVAEVIGPAGLFVDTKDNIYLGYNGGWDLVINGSGCRKFSPEGELVWEKHVTGVVLVRMTGDAVGNLFLSGWFGGPTATFDGNTLTNSGTGEAVFLAKLDATVSPTLTGERASNTIRLSWSALASDFFLESTADISSGTIWTSNAVPPSVVGISNVVTLPLSDNRSFYRLKRL